MSLTLSGCGFISSIIDDNTKLENAFLIFKDRYEGKAFASQAVAIKYATDEMLRPFLSPAATPYFVYTDTAYLSGHKFVADVKTMKDYVRSIQPDTVYIDASRSDLECDGYTVYLNFTPIDFSITYHNLEGAEYDGPSRYNAASEATLPTPTKAHHDFVGFYTDEALTQPFGLTLPVDAPKNLDLYAKWSGPRYLVNYEGLYNVENPNTVTVLDEEHPTLELLPIPSTEHYTFNGWKYGDAYINTLEFASLRDDVTLTADITFKEYQIDYYVDDVLFETRSVNYATLPDYVSPAPPVKEHYGVHWDTVINALKNYEVHAVYQPQNYKITLISREYDLKPIFGQYGDTFGSLCQKPLFDNYYITSMYSDAEHTQLIPKDSIIQENVTIYPLISENYELRKAADFELIAKHPDAVFALKENIDFQSELIPVTSSFSGVFDGEGHIISNFMHQNIQGDDGLALFGNNSGIIKNVTFDDVIFTGKNEKAPVNGDSSIGFLTSLNAGKIENVKITNSNFNISCKMDIRYSGNSLTSSAGLFAAVNSGSINSCSVDPATTLRLTSDTYAYTNSWRAQTMTGNFAFGNIVGLNKGEIENVSASNETKVVVTRTNEVSSIYDTYFNDNYFHMELGGIVGQNDSQGNLKASKSSAKLDVEYELIVGTQSVYAFTDVGGLVGYNKGTIERCYATDKAEIAVNTNGEQYLGGIAGCNIEGGKIKTSYSFATYVISFGKANYVGGLAGSSDGSISNSYAVMEKLSFLGGYSATGSIGGFLGLANSVSSISNCFTKVDIDVSYTELKCNQFASIEEGAIAVKLYGFYSSKKFENTDNLVDNVLEADIQDTMKVMRFEDYGYEFDESPYPNLGF